MSWRVLGASTQLPLAGPNLPTDLPRYVSPSFGKPDWHRDRVFEIFTLLSARELPSLPARLGHDVILGVFIFAVVENNFFGLLVVLLVDVKHSPPPCVCTTA